MARPLLSIPSAGAISILQVGCLMRPAFVATLQPAARRGTLLLLIQNTAGHRRFFDTPSRQSQQPLQSTRQDERGNGSRQSAILRRRMH